MKRHSSGDRDPGGGGGGGISADERLAGFFGGLLQRYPWAPKVLLWLVIGLVLAGFVLSFL